MLLPSFLNWRKWQSSKVVAGDGGGEAAINGVRDLSGDEAGRRRKRGNESCKI